MSKFDPATVEALADAWASIDGKLEDFRAGKGKDIEAPMAGTMPDTWSKRRR